MAKVLRKIGSQDWREPFGHTNSGNILGLFIPRREGYNKGTLKMKLLIYPIIGCFLIYGISFGALLQIAQERVVQNAIAVNYVHYSLHELSEIGI